MAVSQKLISFLEKSKIKYPSAAKGGKEIYLFDYELLKHKTVYTAYDKAATLRVPEKTIGKTLLVRMDKNPALVLISANKNLDKQKLKKVAKVRKIDFIKEVWMKKNLKGTKVGAIPPFGNLWQLQTFVDRDGVMKNQKIIISAGDYNYSIKINPAVFKKIIPDLIIGNFSKKK